MLYYLGKGTEFKKEDCKEYKTIEGALKAAAKNEELVVWDENGNVIGSLTDNVPEGALETNPDGSVNTYNADLNEQAQERLDTIMEQMKIVEGVTEKLKCTRQMEWVQRCNNIRNRAEEIVLHEMIYL